MLEISVRATEKTQGEINRRANGQREKIRQLQVNTESKEGWAMA